MMAEDVLGDRTHRLNVKLDKIAKIAKTDKMCILQKSSFLVEWAGEPVLEFD